MRYIFPLTLFFAPLYIWRFSPLGLPLNALIVWIVFVWVFSFLWLRKNNLFRDFLNYSKNLPHWYLYSIFGFLFAGTISLFVGGLSIAKLGQYAVLCIQPISVFFLAKYYWDRDEVARRWFIWSAYAFVFISGGYALIQYATLVGVPIDWWGNPEEPKRAVSFFLHPNFYTLFATPLLAFLMPTTFSFLYRSEKRDWDIIWLKLILWGTGVLGIVVSLSRGAWIGLVAAAIVWVIVQRSKQLWAVAVLALLIALAGVWIIPGLHARATAPFKGEKSSLARLSLWDTGWRMIQDDPVLGKGIVGFSNNWDKYNQDKGLAHYPGPHNIFLQLWIDTGLIGLISFVFIAGYALIKTFYNRTNLYIVGAGLFIIAMVVHGLVDIPYFKNDLALLFWLVLGFI